MLLRLSNSNSDDDLGVVVSGTSENKTNVPHERALVAFTEAVHGRDAQAVSVARKELIDKLGPEGMVNAAAIAANFDGITRVADGIGIELDSVMEGATEELRNKLGLHAFQS